MIPPDREKIKEAASSGVFLSLKFLFSYGILLLLLLCHKNLKVCHGTRVVTYAPCDKCEFFQDEAGAAGRV